MKFKYYVGSYYSIDGWDVPGFQGLSLVEGLDKLGQDSWELVLAIVTPGEPESLTEYHFKKAV